MPTTCSLPGGSAVDVPALPLHFSAMLSTKARPITRHEYAIIPVGAPNYQLIEGDLVMAPSPGSYHQNIAGRIYRLIGNFLDSHPLGTVFIAPLDVHLSDINVYQPDLLFIRK